MFPVSHIGRYQGAKGSAVLSWLVLSPDHKNDTLLLNIFEVTVKGPAMVSETQVRAETLPIATPAH